MRSDVSRCRCGPVVALAGAAVTLEVGGNVDTDDICTEIPLCVERTVQQALLDLPPLGVLFLKPSVAT